MMKRTEKGFTLVELMIVVAIIGILAAIAYPSYQENVRSSRRADAQTALVGFAGALERYYAANNTYVGAVDGSKKPLSSVFPSEAPLDGNTKFYDLTADVTATTYTVYATPKGGQAGDKCGKLSYTSAGVKGVSSGTVAECWR